MKKIISMVLLTVTVYLHTGEIHKYQGDPTVYESQSFETSWSHIEFVAKEKHWFYYPEIGASIIEGTEVTAPYLIIADKSDVAVGIYPKTSVSKIEHD